MAIAEAMRLAMARYDVEVGDLEIDHARDELSYRIGGDGVFIGPSPGSSDWPAPDGIHRPAWERLFLQAGPSDLKAASMHAEAAFTDLFSWVATRHPDLPPTFGSALKERRNPVTGALFFIVS
ncbi:hypothetical protein [Streptomyces sp. bgisy082]|uniref:hypothetical protein n=1 Tax=Streptomyces sp. bgisy082 TaxID=3413776 RepID=UPI003D7578D8